MRNSTPTEHIDIDARISAVLPLIYEASSPYLDWLFDGRSAALPIIESRMRAPESEVSVRDTVVQEGAEGDVIGCFIAMSGAEVERRRKVDAVAYLQCVGRAGRAGLLQRMRESRDLFAALGPEEFYLSKIAVRPDVRGRGHGRTLLEHFLSMGAGQGHTGFVLDVNSGNAAAIRLYRSFGFQVERGSGIQGTGIEYVTMRLATSGR